MKSRNEDLRPNGPASALSVRVTVADARPVRFRQFYYPGWKAYLLDGRIDMGHARALLGLAAAAQIAAASRIVARGLSVREAEALVARHGKPAAAAKGKPARSRDVVRLEEELADALGASVHLDVNAKGRGKLAIAFSSLDQLDGIVARLRRR